ncbi:MAG: hypothetical protein HYV97_03970 [Bdellovibrio sp.]|nr:hypothetical protein [Bdellovibrio sp.]
MPLILFFILICSCNFACASHPEASHLVRNFVFFNRDRQRISESSFLETKNLVGAQLMYAWRELEPSEDVYDFSEIQQDLKYLSSKGKKLFIQLQDTTFSASMKAVPKYLLDEARFNGGVDPQCDSSGKTNGWVARRWDPAVRERFHKLLHALGKAFDGKIEGLNLQETSIEVIEEGPNAPKGFTPKAYLEGILVNMQVLKDAFPTSVTMQYANFMPGEWLPHEDHSYLRSVYQFAEEKGIGIGTPDLMPEHRHHKNHAYKLMHELTAPIPVGVAVQDGNYIGRTNDDTVLNPPWPNLVPALSAFAQDYLRARYIFWGAQEPYFGHDVILYLREK